MKPKNIHIGIINIMPSRVREKTHVQWITGIQTTTHRVDISYIGLPSHRYFIKNGDKTYSDIKKIKGNFDGLIFTGAAVEFIPDNQIEYVSDLVEIIEATKNETYSNLYSCWSSHFALKYFYGVEKQISRDKKYFGNFIHTIETPEHCLCKNLENKQNIPHSRYGNVTFQKLKARGISILIGCENQENGFLLASDSNSKNIFLQGHPEYSSDDLGEEYFRDLGTKNETPAPENYFHPNSNRILEQDSNVFFHTFLQNWLDIIVKRKESAN